MSVDDFQQSSDVEKQRTVPGFLLVAEVGGNLLVIGGEIVPAGVEGVSSNFAGVPQRLSLAELAPESLLVGSEVGPAETFPADFLNVVMRRVRSIAVHRCVHPRSALLALHGVRRARLVLQKVHANADASSDHDSDHDPCHQAANAATTRRRSTNGYSNGGTEEGSPCGSIDGTRRRVVVVVPRASVVASVMASVVTAAGVVVGHIDLRGSAIK